MVLGVDGFLTDDDLHLAVRILTMSNADFELYTQDDHEEDDQLEEGLYTLGKNKIFRIIVCIPALFLGHFTMSLYFTEKLRRLPTAVKLILKL